MNLALSPIQRWATLFQNDFLALSQAFSLPEIDYTDISQREQLAAAIKRWPLLAEFAQPHSLRKP
ncbi:Putative cytoplasmic protein [Salmonella enterica subsp. enterica serovar Typhimurium str. TN061786]|nr:Putative cytoplasmic protein [Salmonella enterica subsp. enterica serovar Typhimurium str. TN061786]